MNKAFGDSGKFISFEGGEGTGKSTQAKLLSENLVHHGIKSLCTREPGGTALAEKIRALLVSGSAGKLDGYSEALLHFAARRSHLVETIWPNLERGTWVITDRFSDSSMAYQGTGMEVGKESIEVLDKLIMGDFFPDLTFIMDMGAEEGLLRAKKRADGTSKYEKMELEFHKKVREGFLEIACKNQERCVVIDSSQSIETIGDNILNVVTSRFKL